MVCAIITRYASEHPHFVCWKIVVSHISFYQTRHDVVYHLPLDEHSHAEARADCVDVWYEGIHPTALKL